MVSHQRIPKLIAKRSLLFPPFFSAQRDHRSVNGRGPDKSKRETFVMKYKEEKGFASHIREKVHKRTIHITI